MAGAKQLLYFLAFVVLVTSNSEGENAADGGSNAVVTMLPAAPTTVDENVPPIADEATAKPEVEVLRPTTEVAHSSSNVADGATSSQDTVVKSTQEPTAAVGTTQSKEKENSAATPTTQQQTESESPKVAEKETTVDVTAQEPATTAVVGAVADSPYHTKLPANPPIDPNAAKEEKNEEVKDESVPSTSTPKKEEDPIDEETTTPSTAKKQSEASSGSSEAGSKEVDAEPTKVRKVRPPPPPQSPQQEGHHHKGEATNQHELTGVDESAYRYVEPPMSSEMKIFMVTVYTLVSCTVITLLYRGLDAAGIDQSFFSRFFDGPSKGAAFARVMIRVIGFVGWAVSTVIMFLLQMTVWCCSKKKAPSSSSSTFEAVPPSSQTTSVHHHHTAAPMSLRTGGSAAVTTTQQHKSATLNSKKKKEKSEGWEEGDW